MLKVIEVFESIQGEGNNAGKIAIFVRFSGCNLRCSFCDTKYSWEGGKEFSIKELMDEIRKYTSKFVILTGGEPLIQPIEDLERLIDCLHEYGYKVGVETNGTIRISPFKLRFDWVTVSPKSQESFVQKEGNELKLLYDGSQSDELLNDYLLYKFDYYYLQPILPEKDLIHTENTSQFMMLVRSAVIKCVEAARRFPNWRVSFQAQKIVGVR